MMNWIEKGEKLHQNGLKNKMSMVFKEAVKIYDLKAFYYVFVNMPLFEKCFTGETVYSQSPKYILELFCEECSELPKSTEKYEADVAEWIGYLIADWYLEKDFHPHSLLKEHFDWLWYGYETLHTQDVKYVYQVYQEEITEIKLE